MSEAYPNQHSSDESIVPMSVEDIRGNFTDFFAEEGYMVTNGNSVLPEDDPTLMFINSGMAPMKSYFNGEKQPPADMLTNSQQCIRTNDLPDVGDSHHGTSFRMLGSWRFGEKFSKEAAIEEAWKFLTQRLGISANRLLATYLKIEEGGHPSLRTDDESYEIWQRFMAKDRIIGSPAEDNLWGPAGETGPCGPCTETFFDRGAEYGIAKPGELVDGRHIEVWNSGVFVENEKMPDGSIVPLAMKSVDAGAGLERLALMMQGVPSIYDIDQHAPGFAEVKSQIPDETAARIVYDHLKTSAILIDSGIKPGNKREPYVLRRLMRRAFSQLHVAGVSLGQAPGLLDAVRASTDETPYSVVDLHEAGEVFDSEIKSFERVLRTADKHLTKITQSGSVDIKAIQKLKSTYGVPEDLVRAHCKKHGIEFPQAELDALNTKSTSVH